MGVVSRVEVEEGSRVSAGDLLLALDDEELTAAVAAAGAEVEQARLAAGSFRHAGSPAAGL